MSSPDDLLPGNATDFERAQSKTSARILATDTNVIRRERDAGQCDAAFLPFLAAERSVHHYDGDTATKRARTAASFNDHLAYGTAAALEAEIAQDCGFPVRVIEFHEDPTLEWPDFIVEAVIDPGQAHPDMGKAMRAALLRKNVRDWPKPRIRVRQPVADVFVAAACHMSSKVRILPLDAVKPTPQIFVSAASRMMPKVTILPLRTQ